MSARSELVRHGLAELIRGEPDFEITGSDTAADVLVIAEPDIDWSELDVTASAVVLLVDEREPESIVEALRAGVRAVLPAGSSRAELIGAIHAAAAGLAVVRPAELGAVLAAPVHEDAVPDGAGHLSPRELEVLQMLAEGYANKEIAWRLNISEHTVKFHVASILNRLSAGSRAQAVAIGIRRGLITI